MQLPKMNNLNEMLKMFGYEIVDECSLFKDHDLDDVKGHIICKKIHEILHQENHGYFKLSSEDKQFLLVTNVKHELIKSNHSIKTTDKQLTLLLTTIIAENSNIDICDSPTFEINEEFYQVGFRYFKTINDFIKYIYSINSLNGITIYDFAIKIHSGIEVRLVNKNFSTLNT
jgi:hypothetical protein